MRCTTLWLSIAALAVLAGYERASAQTTRPASQPEGTQAASLEPIKDVRIFFHSSEVDFNGGVSTRLRARAIQSAGGEVILMDFDHAALKTVLDNNKGKTVYGRLNLVVREVQNGPGKVEAAALDTASDWIEGAKNQAKADKGEPTFSAAKFDEKPWTATDGKEVKNLREVIYDVDADKVKTLLAEQSLTVNADDKDRTVSLELDAKFLAHLARDANCKGLVLFTRDAKPLCDFYSREQHGKVPALVIYVR